VVDAICELDLAGMVFDSDVSLEIVPCEGPSLLPAERSGPAVDDGI